MKNTPKWFIGTLLATTVISLLGYSTGTLAAVKPAKTPVKTVKPNPKVSKKIVKFTSKTDFKNYLTKAERASSQSGQFFTVDSRAVTSVTTEAAPLASTAPSSEGGKNTTADAVIPERVSGTNVQVMGVDEPDIFKTNGTTFYYSHGQRYTIFRDVMPTPMPVTTERASLVKPILPGNFESTIDIIKALPAKDMEKIASLSKTGDLLLSGNILIVLSYDGLYAFDVSDTANMKDVWQMKYTDSTYVSARLHNGIVYLVLRDNLQSTDACDIQPVTTNGKPVIIKCTDIYRPTFQTNNTTTFYAMSIDSQKGAVKAKVSFLGAGYQPIVYQSEDNLYVSYDMTVSQLTSMVDFLKTKASDIVGKDTIARINKVMAYDLDDSSKLNEVQKILEKVLGQTSDQKLEKQTELSNRLSAYVKAKLRDLEKTGVVKIALNNMTVTTVGEFPGKPLNQFAFDEWNGNLRVASTIAPSLYLYGQNYSLSARGESVSDVSVLDTNLNLLSTVKGLGVTERIYSVRFVGPRGYVVTFRQTDPFYVLDMSNPKGIYKAGELKIPGFSSYLHPLKDNLVLGVGQDEGKVKLSLFNVSDPYKPTEIAVYKLEEYWTEAANNHHAFLQDAQNQLFFIPGGQGGYVISYANDTLKLLKAYEEYGIKRAVFIGNTLYFIGDNSITAFDETTWEKIKTLDISAK